MNSVELIGELNHLASDHDTDARKVLEIMNDMIATNIEFDAWGEDATVMDVMIDCVHDILRQHELETTGTTCTS